LLNEECVLTTLDSVLEKIKEEELVPERLMFQYQQNFSFIKKVNKIGYSHDITSFLESISYKPVFPIPNKAKLNRFVILELGLKITDAPSIQRFPPNIMDIFSCRKDNLFEIMMLSLFPGKNIYLETNTVATIKDDMIIEFDNANIINNSDFNGSPIFIVMNYNLILIGIYNYVSDNSKNAVGYLLNYANPIQNNSYYEGRETIMTMDTQAETRKSNVNFD
jgi:hypothetical protein